MPNEEIPTTALDKKILRKVFANVSSRTGSEIKDEFSKHVATQKLGWWLVFVWAVLVPLGTALLEWWSDYLGLVVLGYAFITAAIKALQLTGHLPKSKRTLEKEARTLRKEHYFYHCERNPEAFERLKAENFCREEVERTKSEAAALKARKQG